MYIFQSKDVRLKSIWAHITQFVTKIETSETPKVCYCEWTITSNDDPLLMKLHGPNRRVIKESHPTCPVHTKEGLLIAFLTYLHPEIGNVINSVLEKEAKELANQKVDFLPFDPADLQKLKDMIGRDELYPDDRCQPIGCDNGHHLAGCKYITVDEDGTKHTLIAPGYYIDEDGIVRGEN